MSVIRWDGFYNARDFDGLPALDGARIHAHTMIRSADLQFVTDPGWQKAIKSGVRTVIDLRRTEERAIAVGRSKMPSTISVVNVELDDVPEGGTPLCFAAYVEEKPEQCARALITIAEAEAGGIIFHCGAGRDRTGLVAVLLLSLLGVPDAYIVQDYELSNHELGGLFRRLGRDDPRLSIQDELNRRNTTVHDIISQFLRDIDVLQSLREFGFSSSHVATLRQRAIVPSIKQ